MIIAELKPLVKLLQANPNLTINQLMPEVIRIAKGVKYKSTKHDSEVIVTCQYGEETIK